MDENRQVANAWISDSGGNIPQACERRQERTTLSVPVQIISHGTAKQSCAQGVCVDISLAGVAFVTEADLHLTDIVELIFEPKDQPSFRQYVRLLYRLGSRYGGYFAHLRRAHNLGGSVCESNAPLTPQGANRRF